MKLKIVSIIIIGTFYLFTSCKKSEKGPVGPTGPIGATGNSNVKLLIYGRDSITSSKTDLGFSFPSTITSSLLDSSVVLTYVFDSFYTWNVIPGMIHLSQYINTSTYYDIGGLRVEFKDMDGSPYSGPNEIFLKSKILIIPASEYSGHRSSQKVDFTNYKETMTYFGLSED